MTLNPYRLKHLARTNPGAKRAEDLLRRPDRLLGMILIGNNFANISTGAIATLIAHRYLGETGALISSIVLTLFVLILAEVAPKTLAAMYPERVAFPLSIIIKWTLWILYPLVYMANGLSNGILLLLGVKIKEKTTDALTKEELKSVVHDAGRKLPRKHRAMMLSIIDLEQISIDEIMVPRNQIVGIDLENDWNDIKAQLESCQHTILPVYEGDINKTKGVVHIKNIFHLMAADNFNEITFKECLDECYFVPEGTSMAMQLINFQKNKRRQALIVNEYGDVIGLVVLEDILEEIVGEYTTDMASTRKDIHPQEDGSVLVDGSVNIRFLNRTMSWDLPLSSPKTINGIIIEILEYIPEVGTCLLLGANPAEVVQLQNNRIKTVRVFPPIKR